ncbi:hypothetical protein U9M48_026731 [Paspalum notatum var. saurae]|uniref:Uncharacterized protein n=1 Tax=Paspalum notatum var. saurae TaxID=547442 RepID=A0AAQ3TTA6_PASNO
MRQQSTASPAQILPALHIFKHKQAAMGPLLRQLPHRSIYYSTSSSSSKQKQATTPIPVAQQQHLEPLPCLLAHCSHASRRPAVATTLDALGLCPGSADLAHRGATRRRQPAPRTLARHAASRPPGWLLPTTLTLTVAAARLLLRSLFSANTASATAPRPPHPPPGGGRSRWRLHRGQSESFGEAGVEQRHSGASA